MDQEEMRNDEILEMPEGVTLDDLNGVGSGGDSSANTAPEQDVGLTLGDLNGYEEGEEHKRPVQEKKPGASWKRGDFGHATLPEGERNIWGGNLRSTGRAPSFEHDENGKIKGYATTKSIVVRDPDGKYAVIPTVINGLESTPEDAERHYRETGEHWGRANSEEEAADMASDVHSVHQQMYGEGWNQFIQDNWDDISDEVKKDEGVALAHKLRTGDGEITARERVKFGVYGSGDADSSKVAEEAGLEPWRVKRIADAAKDEDERRELFSYALQVKEGGGKDIPREKDDTFEKWAKRNGIDPESGDAAKAYFEYMSPVLGEDVDRGEYEPSAYERTKSLLSAVGLGILDIGIGALRAAGTALGGRDTSKMNVLERLERGKADPAPGELTTTTPFDRTIRWAGDAAVSGANRMAEWLDERNPTQLEGAPIQSFINNAIRGVSSFGFGGAAMIPVSGTDAFQRTYEIARESGMGVDEASSVAKDAGTINAMFTAAFFYGPWKKFFAPKGAHVNPTPFVNPANRSFSGLANAMASSAFRNNLRAMPGTVAEAAGIIGVQGGANEILMQRAQNQEIDLGKAGVVAIEEAVKSVPVSVVMSALSLATTKARTRRAMADEVFSTIYQDVGPRGKGLVGGEKPFNPSGVMQNIVNFPDGHLEAARAAAEGKLITPEMRDRMGLPKDFKLSEVDRYLKGCDSLMGGKGQFAKKLGEYLAKTRGSASEARPEADMTSAFRGKNAELDGAISSVGVKPVSFKIPTTSDGAPDFTTVRMADGTEVKLLNDHEAKVTITSTNDGKFTVSSDTNPEVSWEAGSVGEAVECANTIAKSNQMTAIEAEAGVQQPQPETSEAGNAAAKRDFDSMKAYSFVMSRMAALTKLYTKPLTDEIANRIVKETGAVVPGTANVRQIVDSVAKGAGVEIVKPNQENRNETGSGSDEAPAQPEQSQLAQKRSGRSGGTVEGPAPGEKPPEAGVVEPPAAENGAGVTQGGAGAVVEPKAGEETSKSAKPAEAASRVSYATAEREPASAEPAEGPLPSFLAPETAPAKDTPAAKPAEKPMPKSLRKAVDRISSAIGKRTGTGVVTPDEADGIVMGVAESPEVKHNRFRDFFNPLEKNDGWHESLGLDAESAKNIRDAVARAKADADLKKWFPSVDAAVKKAKNGKLSRTDAIPLFGKISEGIEKAERMGLSDTAKRLRDAAEVIRPVAEEVSQGDVDRFGYTTKGRKLNSRLGGTDKRGANTVSLESSEGKTLDVADGGGNAIRTVGTSKLGSMGQGGSLVGNRRLIIDRVNGDELTVTMKDAAGKTIATRNMSRAQWGALAKGSSVTINGDPANPQKGDRIRMSLVGEDDAPEAFMPDAWTPEKQKPFKSLTDVLSNVVTVGGKKVSVKFVPKPKNASEGSGSLMKNASGVVVGEYDAAKGEVRLYPGARVQDVVHEFVHPLMDHARAEASAGRPQLLSAMNGIIRNAPQVVKDAVREKYGDRPEEEILEEILTHTLGWIGEGSEESPGPFGKAFKTLEGRAWYNRLWDAIKNLWKAFATKMGWNKADIEGIDKMKPEAAARKILAEMAKGRYFGDAPIGGMEGDAARLAKRSKTPIDKSEKIWYNTPHNMAEGVGNDRGSKENSQQRPVVGGRGEAQAVNRTLAKVAGLAGRGDGAGEASRPLARIDKQRFTAAVSRAAREEGAWIDDVSKIADTKHTLGSGQESIVHLSRDGKSVIKLNKFTLIDSEHSPQDFFDGIKAYNEFAPDTRIDVIGFTENKDGEVCAVISQPRVEAQRYATQAEINEYMKERGFTVGRDGRSGRITHTSADYTITDAEPRNVLVGKDGNLYFIDLIFDRNKVVANSGGDNSPLQVEKRDGNNITIAWRNEDGEVMRRATLTLDQLRAFGAASPEMKALVERIERGDAGSSVREARRVVLPKPPGSHIMDDERSAREKFTEKYIDSFAPVKTVQDDVGGVQEIVRADGYTDHTRSTDLVAAKDKANGRLEYEIRQHQNRVDDITEDVARAALPKQSTADLVDDFNLYLQCMHAPERNRSIAADRGDTYTPDYSDGMGMVTLPGGTGTKMGLSENVATQILNWMRGKYGVKFGMFQRAADKLYRLLEDDLDRRFEAGRLSADELAFYKDRWHGAGGAPGEWAHYVPLKTDMERLEPDAINSSTAGIRRNEFMKAQGRGSSDIADSPFAAAVLQTEQGIRGSIRNEVANVEANLVRLAESRGNPIAEIVPGDEIRRGRTYSFTFADGETVDASGSMRLVANHPEIHLFKRDGQLYAIRYEKGANGRGLAFANAAGGDNMSRWGQGVEWVPRATHWMSAMRTQYSPEFTLSNMLADNLEAVQALVGRYGIGGGVSAFAKAVASEISNMPDLARYLAGGQPRGYVKEFVEAGGLTKGGVASQGFDAETAEIRSNIERFRREQKSWLSMSPMDYAKSIGRNVGRFISFANELLEYSTRAGIYTALRKNGVPVQEAVKFARDATVNFNRKGTAMPYINGLYMFSNASVQGAVRSLQAMGDVHGGQLVATLVAIGVASAVIDHFLGNDEKRESAGGRNARNLSEYDKKHNVGVPIGGGKQLNLFRFRGPYAAVPYLAKTIANVLLGETSPEDAATTLFKEFGDQITDLVGGNGLVNDKGEFDSSLFAQSIAPSAADLGVQLLTGKDYKGDEFKRKRFDESIPLSSNGKDSTGEWYKDIAKFLNRISGGNENRPGKFDVAPESLKLIVEFAGGGPMRDINNAVATFSNAKTKLSGGEPENTWSQIPFVRRLVREYPESTSRYFDAIKEYERDKKEFAKATHKRQNEMRADKPYLFAGRSLLDGQIDEVQDYIRLARGEVKVGNSWKKPDKPVPEKRKSEYHKQALEMQARILKKLGK